jgi:hypothetical protein
MIYDCSYPRAMFLDASGLQDPTTRILTRSGGCAIVRWPMSVRGSTGREL